MRHQRIVHGVVVGDSVADREPLEVEGSVVDESRGQSRNVNASVALASDVEVVCGIFWKSLEEVLESFVVVEGSLSQNGQVSSDDVV